jgi:hypothetical protein
VSGVIDFRDYEGRAASDQPTQMGVRYASRIMQLRIA